MQGTGTQADPYIPETWEEFVTAVGTTSAYVELPEGGGVFDMNDINPVGGFTININCKDISGNDWEIRNANNIRFMGGSQTIDKLHFLNFNVDTRGNNVFYLPGATLTQCKFSGICSSDIGLFSVGAIIRCSFNLKFIGNALRYFDGEIYVYYSKIVLDHSESTSTESFGTYTRYYNCFINHKGNAAGGQIYFAGNSSILHSNAGNYILTANGTKVSVTEEQLKDTAYLRSVGFPIMP